MLKPIFILFVTLIGFATYSYIIGAKLDAIYFICLYGVLMKFLIYIHEEKKRKRTRS